MEEQTINQGLIAERKGVSNTTLAVLIILALLITIIGTWAVLSSMAQNEAVEESQPNTNIGIVSLTILPQPVEQTVTASNDAVGTP